MRQKRIQLICKKIQNQATKAEILRYVNSKFPDRLSGFADRTFQEDLKAIKLGEFEFINTGLKILNKKRYYFNIIFSRSTQKYSFHEDSPIPEFNLLDDGERMTLPFLVGILQPYQNIPAVKKVLLGLEDTFDIEEKELKTAKAIVIPKPSLLNEKKIIALSITLLGHISRKECVKFDYISVHHLDERLNEFSIHKVIPLEIRLYENLYYLIGYNKVKNKISNYRLDQIVQSKVFPLTVENSNEIEYFTDKFVNSLRLKEYFENSIGVWCHEDFETVETVEITFSNWAASYVQRLPLHRTQEIIEINKLKNELTLEIKIKLYPYNTRNRRTARERSPELAFLLGRFREFCEVNEEKLIPTIK